jgi:TolB-like protein
MSFRVLTLIALTTIVVGGCATAREAQRDHSLVDVGYRIADVLASTGNASLTQGDTIIVASFVNVNNLRQSSSFGRMVAEQVASRLVQRGHRVVEVRLRQNSVFVSEGRGEFMLSRDVREISRTHNASAVVVGTYAEGGGRVYVSARIVRPNDDVIVATADYDVPLPAEEIRALLHTN